VTGPVQLSKPDILKLFELLNEELAITDTHGELYLVGGAVMCLAMDARAATRDVDAWFQPVGRIREAAARVAHRASVPDHWLNDAVKAWLSPRGTFDRFLERSHLQVYVAQPEYLLAMKCLAMRLGEEFHDLDDVRYLLRYLNLTLAADALAVVAQYFEESQIPVKTRLALEELLPQRP
jgi:predicted nucleotidyltransferase